MDHRLGVAVAALTRLLRQAGELGRVASQALPGPRQRVGGCLVASDQERQQLVAQLPVTHRRTIVVSCSHQQRQDVLTFADLDGAAFGISANRRSSTSAMRSRNGGK